jgi:L-asparagine oxygenase
VKTANRVVQYFDLDRDESVRVDTEIGRIVAAEGISDARDLAIDLAKYAFRLPDSLVDVLRDFRLHETSAALVLRGFPVTGARIGPTPTSWAQDDPTCTLREELYILLVASTLGDVFGWSTLQDGHLVHNVVPIPGHESEQSGHGQELLAWHTEDGFHPHRCDYLALLALRNVDHVPTTVAAVDTVELSARDREVLQERRFLIRPDKEHLRRAEELATTEGERHRIHEMETRPDPCAVLFGSADAHYLRIDPVFMDPVPGDDEAKRALEALTQGLEENLQEVALEPGELLLVDNYKAVHGRSAFRARLDGTDRWLKKVVVTRDLRKSRALREGPGARVLQ